MESGNRSSPSLLLSNDNHPFGNVTITSKWGDDNATLLSTLHRDVLTFETTTGPVTDHGEDGNFLFNVLDFVSAICSHNPIRFNFVVLFLIVLSLLGAIGNVALLFVVLRNSYLRSAPNLLIINIMVADLLHIGSTAPFYIKHEFGRPCWLMGLATCKLRHYIPVVAQASCIFSITALSRERYSAIVRGLESRISRNPRKTVVTLTSSWVSGVMIAIPVLFFTKTTINDLNCLYMPVKSITATVYMFILLAFLYICPLIFITLHHVRIVRTLYHSNASVLARNPSAALQIRARKRLAHIVLVITIFFALFWLPHYVYSIYFVTTKDLDITKNEGVPRFLRHLNFYMTLANSCLNPWIVFVMSSVHRSTLVRFFDCLRCDVQKRKAIRRCFSATRLSASRFSTTRRFSASHHGSARYSTTNSSVLNTRI